MKINDYLNGIKENNRMVLSKAITLLESSLNTDKKKSLKLLDQCIKCNKKAIRIGISGTPGVGKSTFIESIGLHLVHQKYKVAVLTIDPSSVISQGSILGDKTRMVHLANHDLAFIRPSSNNGLLGGVNSNTKDTIALCEAAGYDIIIIETVGVGQSETMVQSMTDIFLFLTLTENGDELQFIKKGVLELSDIIIINKMDLNPKKTEKTKRILENQLHIANKKKQKVFICSALKNLGIEHIWQYINDIFQRKWDNNEVATKRNEQNIFWLKKMIIEKHLESLQQNYRFQQIMESYKKKKIKNPRKIAYDVMQKL